MVMIERNMLVMLNFTLQSDGAGRMECADGAIFDEKWHKDSQKKQNGSVAKNSTIYSKSMAKNR